MSRLRVLVVDDQRDAAQIICTLLELLGHTCVAAMTGADGLVQAAECQPDLAVIDIGLPDISGYEVARALRAQARFDRVYLAALTGWGAANDRERSFAAGFDDHLTKPADLAKLRGLLERARREHVADHAR